MGAGSTVGSHAGVGAGSTVGSHAGVGAGSTVGSHARDEGWKYGGSGGPGWGLEVRWGPIAVAGYLKKPHGIA